MSDKQPPKGKSHEALIAELTKAQGEPIAHAVLPNGELVACRRPTLEEFEDYQESLRKRGIGVSNREICLRTRIHPEEDKLLENFERWPMLASVLSDALGDLAGAGIKATVKKG